jgi:septal ring factor EnvC (AmiA/AmiB activator)
MKTKQVRAIACIGLAVLGGLISPAILRAQPEIGSVMAAAAAAIPVLKADSSLAANLLVGYEKAIRDSKEKIVALNAKITALDRAIAQLVQLKERLAEVETKLKELQAEMVKLKAQVAKEEERIAAAEKSKEKMIYEIKDAKSSLFLMRAVAADRAAASKLLDAMKQRNAPSLGTLLDASARPSSIVSVDVLSPSEIKMIFRVGTLTQCVATRPSCGTTTYAIVK